MESEHIALLRSAFDAYMQNYFSGRDLDRTLALLSPQMDGFGTGIDEVALTGVEFAELYRRDIAQAPAAISFEYSHLVIRPIAEHAGLASAVFSIATAIDGQPLNLDNLRLSAVFVETDGQWLMEHMHISLPAREHAAGESYPLRELEERNRLLQEMVRRKTEELSTRNAELEAALAQVETLGSLLPICAGCKKIRDDGGYWHQVEEYIRDHAGVEFTHGLCPDCVAQYYRRT